MEGTPTASSRRAGCGSSVFKALGAILLMLGAVLGCREYRSALDRRIATLASFVRYLETRERQIRTLGRESRAIATDFIGDIYIGDFAELVATGTSSSEAFAACRGRADLVSEARVLLDGYFADCGADSAEGETRRINDTLEGLRPCLELERGEREKRVRCAYAVGLALGAGLAIALM